MSKLSCFLAYDVRGRIPDQLNDDVVYKIGRAYAQLINPRDVVVGRDIRATSESLCMALTSGFTDAGVNVHDIGLCGTEEIYFATDHFDMDGGIMVTASHNPSDYNGLKFVREQAKPISRDTGLLDIEALVEQNDFAKGAAPGAVQELDANRAYIDHLLTYVDVDRMKPLKLVVNPGNGGAGKVVDLLRDKLPFEFVEVHFDPDPSFPNGIPNPLLPENRSATSSAVMQSGADMGIAWDGDYDRCFVFDENGQFIEGYYIVGLLAKAFLNKNPDQKIIYDPRLTWNTIDIVDSMGGTPVQCKSGHAFIKERMRQEDAVYGGEMSAHHYFRDFAYCDSGMIPWLLIAQLISDEGIPLSEMVADRIRRYPASGEINRKLEDAPGILKSIRAKYEANAKNIETIDGLSMEFDGWRVNLRSSNTEPLLRLNVESRGDETLMKSRTREILDFLENGNGG